MISQFYVLSCRGDTIINRDFRGDIVKGTAEIFFRKVKSWSSDPPPLFVLDGITFMFLKRNGLYFVATTQQNAGPAYCLELLQQMIKNFKDFCGILSEEAIRRNFVLIYEILDEILDCGYPQHTSTERLKQCIRNEAVIVEAPSSRLSGIGRQGFGFSATSPNSFSIINQKTVPSNASHRPVGPVQQTSHGLSGSSTAVANAFGLTKNPLTQVPLRNSNEIFVDILERLTVVTNSSGIVLNSSVDGCIQMKSYLAGNPILRVALNEDVVIRNDTVSSSHNGTNTLRGIRSGEAPQIDDCNFHECVDLRDFESLRVMLITPPDGEFVVMNYRITDDFRLPFRVKPTIEQSSTNKLELCIDIRADIPPHHYGGNLIVTCPMPRASVSVATECLSKAIQQNVDYIQQDKKVVWNIKKLQGGSEASLRCRISLSQPLPSHGSSNHTLTFLRKEIGPISLTFEIPMYNVSNVQVRYLRILNMSSSGTVVETPFRWVRYVTQSTSYVCRL